MWPGRRWTAVTGPVHSRSPAMWPRRSAHSRRNRAGTSCSGSAQLFNMLRQEDIIDWYRLMVHPILLGKGRRLFAEGTDENALTLTHMQALSSGIVILEYESAPAP